MKHTLLRQNALMKHMDKLLKEKIAEGHLGCRYEWDSNRWFQFFQKLSSLKSVSEQFFCVREVLMTQVESLREPAALVEKFLAPLLLIATSAAHVAVAKAVENSGG